MVFCVLCPSRGNCESDHFGKLVTPSPVHTIAVSATASNLFIIMYFTSYSLSGCYREFVAELHGIIIKKQSYSHKTKTHKSAKSQKKGGLQPPIILR